MLLYCTQRLYGLLGSGNPGRSPRLLHRSSALTLFIQFNVALLYTETVRTIRVGEPRTATSTFTQFLSSEGIHLFVVLFVHRNRIVYSWSLGKTGTGGGDSSVVRAPDS